MRVPVELLVLICLVVGIFPALAVGDILRAAATPVVGGVLPEFSLAIWHRDQYATDHECDCLAGRHCLVWQFALAAQPRRARTAHPGAAPLRGKRAFENLLARLSWLARAWRRGLTTQQLQWQMLWLLLLTLVAGALPLLLRGMQLGQRNDLPLSPAFAALWGLGALCALGAAWQAKYHRMAALIMLGGAGLVTCITFLWFSAPDFGLDAIGRGNRHHDFDFAWPALAAHGAIKPWHL